MGMIFLWGSIQTWLPSSIKSSWLNPNAPVSMRWLVDTQRRNENSRRSHEKRRAALRVPPGHSLWVVQFYSATVAQFLDAIDIHDY